MRESLIYWRHTAVMLAAFTTLTACGGVVLRPELQLPAALIQPMQGHVGLVLNEELRKYKHQESRAGREWTVDLGSGHATLFQTMFKASFADAKVFQDLASAQAATQMQALFLPSIEQYSFATANETSGEYWAVTIRYRIGVLTSQGESVDNLTLSGYGSAKGAGGAAKSLEAATQSAMRDAAAKFLVQMPRSPLAVKLRDGQVLSVGDKTAVAVDVIEAVPIEAPPPAP